MHNNFGQRFLIKVLMLGSEQSPSPNEVNPRFKSSFEYLKATNSNLLGLQFFVIEFNLKITTKRF